MSKKEKEAAGILSGGESTDKDKDKEDEKRGRKRRKNDRDLKVGNLKICIQHFEKLYTQL